MTLPPPLAQVPYHQLQLPPQHEQYAAKCHPEPLCALADDPLMSSMASLSEAWAWTQHLAAD